MPFPQMTVKDANYNKVTINTLPLAGQNVSANSLPVVLATDQSNLNVTLTNNQVVISGNVNLSNSTFTPLYLTPISYTSNTIIDARAYSVVIFTFTVAPSSGYISISPDNGNDYIQQTVLLNNNTGINNVTNLNSIGVYSVAGHQYVQAVFANGTCYVAGGQ